jgi:hypothetical protein
MPTANSEQAGLKTLLCGRARLKSTDMDKQALATAIGLYPAKPRSSFHCVKVPL